MTILDELDPLPKYKYRILYKAYIKGYESGHFVVQFRRWWWQLWRSDGHWSIGMVPKFYSRNFDSKEQAMERIKSLVDRSNEPRRKDIVIRGEA